MTLFLSPHNCGFPALRLCKKHGRESGVIYIFVSNMDTITLTLHKKWFDLILYGEKTEEYREIKPYWVRRLIGNWHQYTEKSVFYTGDYIMPFAVSKIRFRNGYAKDAREMIIEWCGIEVKEPNPEWCEPSDASKLVFALKLGRVISSNCK